MKQAITFFETFYPDESFSYFVCATWLLDPKLSDFLPEYSNIMQFQRVFTPITRISPDESYKRWLYGISGIQPDDFTEDTSLQRKVKAFVQAGGQMGIGESFLTKNDVQNL